MCVVGFGREFFFSSVDVWREPRRTFARPCRYLILMIGTQLK